MKREIKNATKYPQAYYARHQFPGLAQYDNERVHFDLPSIKKMLPTFVGKPVYVLHTQIPIDQRLEKINEQADGFVSDSFINPLDGWAWVKFLAVSDEANRKIRDGWSVSNAYLPSKSGAAGKNHNVDYHRKIEDGEYTHLAIVPNPRYEESQIFTPAEYKNYNAQLENQQKELHNSKSSKTNEGRKMFNLFKNTKEEVTNIDEDTMVDRGAGKPPIAFKEMLNAVELAEREAERLAAEGKKKKEDEEKAKAEKTNAVDPEAEIEVAGKKMKIKDVVEKYNSLAEETEKKKQEEETAAEAAKKTAEEEASKKAEAEKTNSKNFNELANANKNFKPVTVKAETNMDKLARGKDLF